MRFAERRFESPRQHKRVAPVQQHAREYGCGGIGPVKLSVIIPTLNEARYLAAAVRALRTRAVLGAPHEIIIADCGSADGSPELAARLGASVVEDNPRLDSRAAALNAGAAHATGDVMLFLDADTQAPRGYDRAIERALRDSYVVGGAFEFALDGTEIGLRIVELINRARYRIWPYFYGDQGIFVRASVFHQIGGYPRRRILEASDLCRKLNRKGKLVLNHKLMKTSPRRFLDGGTFRVLAHDVCIWMLDMMRLSTEKYGPAYQQENRRRGQRG
jgi:glycosyltransferase involved in cell wall biosynthesis